jgi:hypothetical protein
MNGAGKRFPGAQATELYHCQTGLFVVSQPVGERKSVNLTPTGVYTCADWVASAVAMLETGSGPARKLPAFGGDFHFFSFFDEERNADFEARLQASWLGRTAR